ncbi:MAG TPA: MFS transporter, partial [Rhodanobacter sp.]|nr:MFS transporter [Rhodanobacter sp.]
LAQTVTIPLYGKLADVFGRKPVLIIGTLIFLLGSAVSALAWNVTTLIAFRGLQGLGASSIMATVNMLAGDLYSVRERAHSGLALQRLERHGHRRSDAWRCICGIRVMALDFPGQPADRCRRHRVACRVPA